METCRGKTDIQTELYGCLFEDTASELVADEGQEGFHTPTYQMT